MASLNKVLLIGNLGKKPELRFLPSGNAVCQFSIATTESWKDKQTGQKQEKTEWHTIIMFGRLAEIACEYLDKGRPIYVEGRLQTRKWQDKQTGADRYSTEIVADEMKMLGVKPEHREGQSAPASASRPANQQRQPGPAPAATRGFDDFEDDIPFASSCAWDDPLFASLVE